MDIEDKIEEIPENLKKLQEFLKKKEYSLDEKEDKLTEYFSNKEIKDDRRRSMTTLK